MPQKDSRKTIPEEAHSVQSLQKSLFPETLALSDAEKSNLITRKAVGKTLAAGKSLMLHSRLAGEQALQDAFPSNPQGAVLETASKSARHHFGENSWHHLGFKNVLLKSIFFANLGCIVPPAWTMKVKRLFIFRHHEFRPFWSLLSLLWDISC